MSKALTICGFTGTGKTYFCKSVALMRENVIVFDVNNEYNDLPELDLTVPYDGGKFRYTGMNFKKFINIIQDAETEERNIYNTNIVLEDCSGFMKGQIGEHAMKIFQAKRHTNNNYFFLYHAVELVPKDIYRFTNTFILFKTNETIEQISKRFPALKMAAYQVDKDFRMRNNYNHDSPKRFPKQIIKLQ